MTLRVTNESGLLAILSDTSDFTDRFFWLFPSLVEVGDTEKHLWNFQPSSGFEPRTSGLAVLHSSTGLLSTPVTKLLAEFQCDTNLSFLSFSRWDYYLTHSWVCYLPIAGGLFMGIAACLGADLLRDPCSSAWDPRVISWRVSPQEGTT